MTLNVSKEIIKDQISSMENEIVSIIDIIVHIPKKDENPERDELEWKYFNQGYYYAEYCSKELGIPFNNKLIYEYEVSEKGDRKFWISSNFNVRNKKILIIDDTYTRGDIKGAISDDLTEEGASQVYIGVIGRSIS